MSVSGSDTRLVKRHRDGSLRGSLRNRIELTKARAVDRALSISGAASSCLLVSGFMRSGTTWVQECLAASLRAKTVFEPLSPLEPGRKAALAGAFAAGEAVAHGIVPGPLRDDDPVWDDLARACRGGSGSRFSMTCRQGWRDSLSRSVLVKDVRLQFNLAAFHDRFGVPVLHVTRDPRAVVASLLKARWGWSYDGLSLGDVLPRSPDAWTHQAMGRDDVVRRFDGDGASRIAAMWAVTERSAARSLNGKPWARRVTYESLAADPAAAFAAIHGWLGREATGPCDFARRSASTHPTSGSGSPGAAAPTDQDRSRILGIVEALHPDWGARAAVAAA